MSKLITFSEEQTMLLDTAMEFCKNQSPMSKVRAQIETELGFDKADWQSMVDLGWLGITVPEAHGGLGLALADVVPIAESMGRAMMSSPFLATTLASQALIHGASEEQQAEWLPKIVAGSIATIALTEADGNWQLDEIEATAQQRDGQLILSGEKHFVLDAAVADLIVASVKYDGETRLLCIEKSALNANSLTSMEVIDQTRRCYQLNLDGITVAVSNLLPKTPLVRLEQAAMLLLSAEMSGGIASALAAIVEYLNTRKQFDRLIGSYQALKHPTVDILIAAEATRAHVYHAATQIDVAANDVADQSESDNTVEIALRMAKAVASESFAFAGDRAVQFHGGMGFTYECDAQLYLRRALFAQYQFGDEKHQRQLLTPLLLDEA